MFDLLKLLCNTDAAPGRENSVRDIIISKIDGHCDWKVDPLGNIIAFKKGKKPSAKKLMIDAHMDEVGLIITSITKEGFLKFKTVGSIEVEALMFRQVTINGSVSGVISGKPIHLIGTDESKKLPSEDALYIDIGACSQEEAQKRVKVGDCAVINGEYIENDNKIIAKAIDDRIGCAVLVELLVNDSEYDFYASFSVQEELGMRGAKTAAYSVDPDSAIVIEATTAADIPLVSPQNQVCVLGYGPAVSFMDKATVYDREYYNNALESGIPCQAKSAVTGGNNSGAIHLSRDGVRTVALSVPCRYIHSPSCVADKSDCENLLHLAKYMLNGICSGEFA